MGVDRGLDASHPLLQPLLLVLVNEIISKRFGFFL